MAASSSIRSPAVAGLFYPADGAGLRAGISTLLSAVGRGARAPRALIAPHAGHIYSGPTAAAAFGSIDPDHDWRRMAVLGPAHRVYTRGIAAPSAAGFATPLGVMPVDREAIEDLCSLSGVVVADAPHEQEHCIEVQLPFLQMLFGDIPIVPLVVGDAGAGLVAAVIERLATTDTLVVVSSDLSHYLPYDEARQTDARTVQSILGGATDLDGEQACGCRAINGLNQHAAAAGWQAELIDYRNSGDTAGDTARVVGYAAVSYGEAAE